MWPRITMRHTTLAEQPVRTSPRKRVPNKRHMLCSILPASKWPKSTKITLFRRITLRALTRSKWLMLLVVITLTTLKTIMTANPTKCLMSSGLKIVLGLSTPSNIDPQHSLRNWRARSRFPSILHGKSPVKKLRNPWQSWAKRVYLHPLAKNLPKRKWPLVRLKTRRCAQVVLITSLTAYLSPKTLRANFPRNDPRCKASEVQSRPAMEKALGSNKNREMMTFSRETSKILP